MLFRWGHGGVTTYTQCDNIGQFLKVFITKVAKIFGGFCGYCHLSVKPVMAPLWATLEKFELLLFQQRVTLPTQEAHSLNHLVKII